MTYLSSQDFRNKNRTSKFNFWELGRISDKKLPDVVACTLAHVRISSLLNEEKCLSNVLIANCCNDSSNCQIQFLVILSTRTQDQIFYGLLVFL